MWAIIQLHQTFSSKSRETMDKSTQINTAICKVKITAWPLILNQSPRQTRVYIYIYTWYIYLHYIALNNQIAVCKFRNFLFGNRSGYIYVSSACHWNMALRCLQSWFTNTAHFLPEIWSWGFLKLYICPRWDAANPPFITFSNNHLHQYWFYKFL